MKRVLIGMFMLASCVLLTGCPHRDTNEISELPYGLEGSEYQAEDTPLADEVSEYPSHTRSGIKGITVPMESEEPYEQDQVATTAATPYVSTPSEKTPQSSATRPQTTTVESNASTKINSQFSSSGSQTEYTAPPDTGENDSNFELPEWLTPSTVVAGRGVNTVPYDKDVKIEDWFLI